MPMSRALRVDFDEYCAFLALGWRSQDCESVSSFIWGFSVRDNRQLMLKIPSGTYLKFEIQNFVELMPMMEALDNRLVTVRRPPGGFIPISGRYRSHIQYFAFSLERIYLLCHAQSSQILLLKTAEYAPTSFFSVGMKRMWILYMYHLCLVRSFIKLNPTGKIHRNKNKYNKVQRKEVLSYNRKDAILNPVD